MTLTGGTNPNRQAVADAVRIARVAQLGGSSMGLVEADPFYDPLEDTLNDLAIEWANPRMTRVSSGVSNVHLWQKINGFAPV